MANLPRSDDNTATEGRLNTVEFPARKAATGEEQKTGGSGHPVNEDIDLDNPELYLNRELTLCKCG